MIPLTLADIAAATGGTLDHADPDTLVTAPLLFDSRNVTAGGLFACLPGRTADGHDYARQAVADGAVAVLAARPVGVPAVIVADVLTAMADTARAVAARYPGTVIGITGSAGKTTTKDLLSGILALDGPTVATPRSFNNEIGFPVTVTQATADTQYLVLEMGARGRGHIAALCEIAPPTIAAVLGIGSAHAGEFGSREATADAKAEIVRGLPPHGVAVLNADDPLVVPMARQTQARVMFFGTGDADVRAEDVRTGDDGRPHFILRHGADRAPVQLAVHGRHNVTNALAAATIALAAGVPFTRVVEGLTRTELTSGGRMEVTTRPDGVTVINDAFNASPESVLAALQAMQDIAAGRRTIAVLGEMAELGDEAPAWHDHVGEAAAKSGITHLVLVGGEHAEALGEMPRTVGMKVHRASAGRPLAPFVNALLEPDDVILIKGANALGLEAVARELATLTCVGNKHA
ncbi:UDP-N-acetylmuramoyl-tripeptide--D-alanyl-D-alanine ligase [Streptomyces sp. NPDC021224]|uniref:UDP-N-acetylmuramoyl-tripeptide--D-alanyl-D- alanine ligase n=1 Tax=unclassified Streptomyces TaxID=2593676 RepID=UPI0037BCCA50